MSWTRWYRNHSPDTLVLFHVSLMVFPMKLIMLGLSYWIPCNLSESCSYLANNKRQSVFVCKTIDTWSLISWTQENKTMVRFHTTSSWIEVHCFNIACSKKKIKATQHTIIISSIRLCIIIWKSTVEKLFLFNNSF